MLHSKKHSNALMNTQIHPRLIKEGPFLTANPVRGRIHYCHTIALRTKARHRVLATKGMTISLAQPLPQLPRTQTSLPRPPPPQDRHIYLLPHPKSYYERKTILDPSNHLHGFHRIASSATCIPMASANLSRPRWVNQA